MEYFINSSTKTEWLQEKCEGCEACAANRDPFTSYEEYLFALKDCETCDGCKDHGNCATILWSGSIGSLLMDFMSLNFNDLNQQILKIVRKYYKNYQPPKNLNDDFSWKYSLSNEIDQFLSSQHFLFNYCSIGDRITSNMVYYSGFSDPLNLPSLSDEDKNYLVSIGRINVIDAQSFSDLVDQTNFQEYKCLQSIIDQCILDQDFYKMISSKTSPLQYFGLGFTPISKTAEINDLELQSIFAKTVNSETIIEKINEANRHGLYKEPTINEYDVGDASDVISSSFGFVLDMGCIFKKCVNCGKYFIPENKSDTKYCSRKSPQYTHLTCKEAAKYVKQLEREKGDSSERLRKSVYNTLRNRLDSKKALEDEIFYKKCNNELKDFIPNAAQWKADIELGKKTEKQYISWLNSFKKRGPKNGEHSENRK